VPQAAAKSAKASHGISGLPVRAKRTRLIVNLSNLLPQLSRVDISFVPYVKPTF